MRGGERIYTTIEENLVGGETTGKTTITLERLRKNGCRNDPTIEYQP